MTLSFFPGTILGAGDNSGKRDIPGLGYHGDNLSVRERERERPKADKHSK